MQATAETTQVTGSNRTIARLIGFLFISAFFAYGGGSAVIASIPQGADRLSSIAANANPLRVGSLLMLINSVVVAAIGVVMLRIARPHSETIAFGYLAARLVESVLLAVGVVFLLLQLSLAGESQVVGGGAASGLASLTALSIQGNFVAYQVAMIGLSVGSVPFWYLAYRAGFIPRVLAAFGIVGYAIFGGGAIAEIAGSEIGLVLSLPGGLFEVSLGIWLIVKGFTWSPADARGPAREWPVGVPS
jgi:hypothetical protein